MEEASNDQKSSVILKNPQCLLREYCCERDLLPTYDLVGTSGESHCPTFNMTVTVSDLTANGSGKSKAKAKHDAAFNLLKIIEEKEKEKLKVTGESKPIAAEESELVDATNLSSMVKPVDANEISENTVGILQELCMSQKWSLPIYDLISDEPNGHEKLFKMQCVINGQPYEEVGCANSKKLAKKYAALYMLKHFSDLLMGLGHSFGPDENTSDGSYKTPLAILQEVCIQQRFSLSFDFTSMEGEGHDPVFVMQVKAGKFVAEGRGPNKKKAKQASAEAVLQLMEEKGVKLKKEDEPVSPAKVEKAIKNPTEPIGLIKEICIDHEMEKPTYECVEEEGPPHKRVFTIVCIVSELGLKKTGTGESKKIAKKEAALKMYKELRKMNYLPLNDTDASRRGSNESSSSDVSPTKKKTVAAKKVPVFSGITEGAVGLASPDDFYNQHENDPTNPYQIDPQNLYENDPENLYENDPENLFGETNFTDGYYNDPNDRFAIDDLSNSLENTNLHDNYGYDMNSMDVAYSGIGNDLYSDNVHDDLLEPPNDTFSDLALPEPGNFTVHDFSNLDFLKPQLSPDYANEVPLTSPKKTKKGVMGSLKKKLNKL